MDKELAQGVRIIVERCQTNPDEMMDEYGKWSQLREAVFDYMERNHLKEYARSAWLRGLTNDEINTLYDAFGALYRKTFDDYVMKHVLSDEDETEAETQRKLAHSFSLKNAGFTDPRLFQNAIQPGKIYPVSLDSYHAVKMQTSNTSILSRLKQELGIK